MLTCYRFSAMRPLRCGLSSQTCFCQRSLLKRCVWTSVMTRIGLKVSSFVIAGLSYKSLATAQL